MSYTIIFALILASLCLCLAAPIDSSNPYQAFSSPTDISGQPVRQKRQSDYYICYPSSVVYGYHNSPNAQETHRRSGEANRRSSAFDSLEARQDRADRERAAYTDSYGK